MMWKRIAAALAACACLTAGAAMADGANVGNTYRAVRLAARVWAIKCYVADGFEAAVSRKSGDTKDAVKFSARAEASREQIDFDFLVGSDEAKREGDRIVQSPSFLRADLSDCEAMGF
jgi:hypothetical protein